MTYTEGHYYAKNGYLFRVDLIRGGEVYAVRWKCDAGPEIYGSPIRYSVIKWDRDMEGCVECDWQGVPLNERP